MISLPLWLEVLMLLTFPAAAIADMRIRYKHRNPDNGLSLPFSVGFGFILIMAMGWVAEGTQIPFSFIFAGFILVIAGWLSAVHRIDRLIEHRALDTVTGSTLRNLNTLEK